MGCWAALSEEEGRGRKDGGMEKGERGQKKAGVAGQWSIPEDLWTKRTPSFSHTHKHKHTLCILKEKQSQCGAEGSFVDAQQTASEWWCGIDLMLTYMSVSADFVAVFPSYSFNLSLRRLCKTGCYQSKRIKSSKKKFIKITQFRFRGFLLLKVFISLLNCCSYVTGGDDGIICM